MKKLLFVESQEKERILNQHSKQRPINIFEQSAKVIDDAKKLFKRAQTQGCLTDAGLDFNNLRYNKSKPDKIYIESIGKTSGKRKRVYNDFTFEILDPSRKVIKTGTWSCNEQVVTPQQKKDEDLKKYLDQWVTYYSGQPLYKGAQIKHQLDVTPVEKATWKEVSIPNSAKETGSEKFVYISSEKKKEEQGTGDPKKDENPSLKDVRTASDIGKDDCEKVIEQWYQNFATKPEDFDKAYFDKERPRAMYCKRRFYKKWGVDFNASRLNKIIEFMSRTRDNFEGRISPSLRSPWKLD
jgi:hypothetical protein